jgi:hypothetical protein
MDRCPLLDDDRGGCYLPCMPRKRDPNRLPQRPGRPSIYPWSDWLDQRTHVLERGVQYDCEAESLRRQLHKEATKRDLKVRVSNDGTDRLRVRAYVPAEDRRSYDRYDWDSLLDGDAHVLRFGEDLHSKPNSFRVYARQVATARGLKVHIFFGDGVVTVQAIKGRPELDDSPIPIEWGA